MKLSLLMDFDGTATDKDVTEVIFRRFARGNWRKWDKMALTLKVPVHKALSEQFRMVEATPEEVLSALDEEVHLREGLIELVAYLKEVEIPWIIVSEGADFYIKYILGREGLHPDMIFSYRSRFVRGHIEVEPLWMWEGCDRCGTCKRRIVKAFRHLGPVAYVGDSTTDFCVADTVDLLYARGYLKAFAEKQGIPHVPYLDLHQVRKHLKGFLEGEE
ncbi:MAG: hypothetical protein DRN42_00935 [Thermoplasmata archaeon]|nr:MAG: hypothetical protein DRN42_00935 [Thermoplasmata archaeon]